MPADWTIRCREIAADRFAECLARGHRERRLFPRRVFSLPRPGPDGYKLAERMCGVREPSAMWEIVLFADESLLREFPSDLFFDDDLVWHRQHFGLPGHLACAAVVVSGEDMWSMSHVSDLVQRSGRSREHKTRVENRFKGWHDMLLNALLAFASERGVRRLLIPTSELQLRNTDPARRVQPELFERIYDRSVNRLLEATREGDWWLVDVQANRARLVEPTQREERRAVGPAVCVCHDVEAGLGHVGLDDALADSADRAWRENVAAMLLHEHAAGVSATYNVVGCLLADVRQDIESGGHCVAFHSYDHRIDAEGVDQLSACRQVDYRIKGYRVPQSRITAELADENLLLHNFEWLSSSAYSFGFSEPVLENGVVRIPVHVDDHALYRGDVDFDEWRANVLEAVAAKDISVVSLHDCYAHLWLDRYPELLAELQGHGTFLTLDEVAAHVTLAAAL